MFMRSYKLIAIVAVALLPASASAQQEKAAATAAPPGLTAISPIFSQLLMMSQPAGFKPAFENTKGDRYIREAIPVGQTLEGWTELVTVTGARNLAAQPHATPRAFVEQISAGFQNACPETFSSRVIGETKLDGNDAFIAIVGCGALKSGPPRSEAALLIGLKGKADMYTIQWAERGPVATGMKVEIDGKWEARLKALGPIRLCPIVRGEKAPYPSCVGKG